MVFPKFSGIVEENAGYEQIAIKLRINRAKPESHSYHLGSVLDQAATTRVIANPSSAVARATVRAAEAERFPATSDRPAPMNET